MNNLVIGLGGTGGKVIATFRKLIYNEFRQLSPEGVNLRFLYVDSDPRPLAPDALGWKVLGTSTHLPDASKLLIQAENLEARLDDLNSYPGLKPWIGDRNIWAEVLSSSIGVAAAGQKRRLGRFLFACKAAEFREKVRSLAAEMELDSRSSEYTFHVVAGLAGGTGAGAMIDVIAKLRQTYPDPVRHRIIGYFLLPDRFPPANWNTGNYHAGGYAALAELNALSTTAYKPHDVETGERMNLIDPFNGAYLFEVENEKGYKADVENEIGGIAADFLFQKIVVSKDRWDALKRMELAENGDGTPETAPDSKVGQRSKRFLTFGVKRLAIPEEEINEYLGLNFARQAIYQLRYNNWQESLGFADVKRNVDVKSIISSVEKLKSWRFDDEHVTLGSPILPLDDPKKRWRSLDNEWESVAATLKERAQTVDRPRWIDELSKLFEQRFIELFRGVGVPTFFTNKATARREMAREIGGIIETELFNDWRNGVRSITEVSDLLDALILDTARRRDDVEETVARIEKRDEKTREEMRAKREKWAKVGLVGRMIGDPKHIFNDFAISLQEHHVHKTKVAAWTIFGKGLFAEVITELERIRSTVTAITAVIEETLKKVSDGIEERLKESSRDDLSGTFVRFYEPEKVRTVTRDLVIDESIQKEQTAAVRTELVAMLGESPSFRLLENRLTAGQLEDRILVTAEESARRAHDTKIAEARNKVRGISILAKLRERYDRDPQALQSFVSGLIKEAGCFMTVNSSERTRAGPGIPGVPTLVEQWIVVIPYAPEHAEFVKQLQSAFRGAQSGAISFIETEGKQNEITILSLKNLFPLRYLGILPMLRDEYARRIASNPLRHGFEVHGEGRLEDFPPLYLEGGAAFRSRVYSFVLAGLALGAIREENGKFFLYSKTEDGFDDVPITLGGRLIDLPEAVDHGQFAKLKGEVERLLASTPARDALVPRVIELVDSVKPMVGNDLTSPLYRDAVEAGKAAAQLIRAA